MVALARVRGHERCEREQLHFTFTPKIDPLIEESEVLRALMSDPRSRDSGNTGLSK